MGKPDTSATDPTVLIADASEERRHLLMQYVAIEWPNASIKELEGSIHALAGKDSPVADCDMVVIGLSGEEASESGSNGHAMGLLQPALQVGQSCPDAALSPYCAGPPRSETIAARSRSRCSLQR